MYSSDSANFKRLFYCRFCTCIECNQQQQPPNKEVIIHIASKIPESKVINVENNKRECFDPLNSGRKAVECRTVHQIQNDKDVGAIEDDGEGDERYDEDGNNSENGDKKKR